MERTLPAPETTEIAALREEVRRLRRHERLYKRAFRQSPIVFACTGADLRYNWIFNPHPDFDPAAIVGKRDDELATGVGIQELVQMKQRVLLTGQDARQDIMFDRSDGPRVYDVFATPMCEVEGAVECVLTTALDVTERKRAEQLLQETAKTLDFRVSDRTRQVEELTSQLIIASQQERSRIAQLLHDDLQQQLYGVLLQLRFLRQDAEAGRTDAVLDRLTQAEEWLARGQEMTRNLAMELSPPVLDEPDFATTLRWLANHMKELHGLPAELHVISSARSSNLALRVLLFRIVRELLFNIVKHAGATKVAIELHGAENSIEVRIIDDGCGFDTSGETGEAEITGGFGLFAVRKRLQMLGGQMTIDSAPGAGTRTLVIAPLTDRPIPDRAEQPGDAAAT